MLHFKNELFHGSSVSYFHLINLKAAIGNDRTEKGEKGERKREREENGPWQKGTLRGGYFEVEGQEEG